MRNVPVALAMLLLATAASAQSGPPPGGGRGAGEGGPGGGGPGMRRHMPEMKPLKREKFDKAVTALFETGDTDRDGYATLAELRAAQAARHQEVITERFKQIDSDRSGSISSAEFSQWQQQLGSAVLSDELTAMRDVEIIPDIIRPKLGDSADDMMIERLIDPLSATMIVKANVNYDGGVTLAEMLAYQGERFAAADRDGDGKISMEELRFLAPDREAGPQRPGVPPGPPPGAR